MSHKVIINESDFKRLFEEYKMSYEEYYKSLDPWFDAHRGEDGYIDDIMIVKECLPLLKKSKGVFSSKHDTIRLENGCAFHINWIDVQKGDFSLWEVWVPGGGSIDGLFADEDFLPEDEELAEEYLALDLEIQEEIANHTVFDR